jgi:hypothetical protein
VSGSSATFGGSRNGPSSPLGGCHTNTCTLTGWLPFLNLKGWIEKNKLITNNFISNRCDIQVIKIKSEIIVRFFCEKYEIGILKTAVFFKKS